MKIITPMSIDVSLRGISPRIYAKQGDNNTRVLELTITDGATPVCFDRGSTAQLRCLKPNGSRVVTDCTLLSDSLIQVILPEQLLSVPGLVLADIALFGDDGQLLSTVVFQILVESAPTAQPTASEPEQPDDPTQPGGTEEPGSPQQPAVSLKKSAGQAIAPVVSFVDDDCRSQVYSVLFPWMKEHSIPYCFAVPVGSVGGNGLFATWAQLQEMAGNSLVSFSCHCVGDDVMSSFSVPEMDQIIRTWFTRMKEKGLLSNREQARTYMYCHGVYADPIVRSVVSRYFRAGFTVTKGINTTPFDSFHMNRVGLFPQNGSFTLADAKAYVDTLFEKGGWLVFFTHCYYDSFDLDGLSELVSYIRAKGVPIRSVEDVLTQYGNLQDLGCFNKRNPDNPYLVTDYLGNIYCSDGPVRYDFEGTPTPVPGALSWLEIDLASTQYRVIAKSSSASAGLTIESNSENLYVTQPVSVKGLSAVKLTGYAISGFGQFSFLDASGALVQCSWSDVAAVGANGIYQNLVVPIPAGAASIIVAGSALRQMPRLFVISTELETQPDSSPVQEGNGTWQSLPLSNTRYRLIAKSTSASAGLAITASSENAYVSAPIPISGYSAVKVTGNATSGYGKYSFLASDGSLVQCCWSESTAAGAGGNFIHERVTVPAGAASIIISGTATRQMPALSVLVSNSEGGELQ